MPKPDPRPAGAALTAAPDAAPPPVENPPPEASSPAAAAPASPEPDKPITPTVGHYFVVTDLPGLAEAGRVLKASPARVRAWLDASAVRIATSREIELAEPRFVVLED